jgi:hypothetical protein
MYPVALDCQQIFEGKILDKKLQRNLVKATLQQ